MSTTDLEARLVKIAWTMVEMPCSTAVMKGLREAAAMGAATERARIVAWLRDTTLGFCDIEHAADAIEAGEAGES